MSTTNMSAYNHPLILLDIDAISQTRRSPVQHLNQTFDRAKDVTGINFPDLHEFIVPVRLFCNLSPRRAQLHYDPNFLGCDSTELNVVFCTNPFFGTSSPA